MSLSAVAPASPERRMLVPAVVAAGLAALALLRIIPAWQDMSLHLGDTDNAMRLVQVRAFLDGRGWYDVFEPRMNAPIGLLSHWSRLFDAPLAAVVLLFQPWLGRAGAELIMRGLWPLLVLAGTLAGLWRIADRLGGTPVAVLTVFAALNTLPLLGAMLPGSIDHTGFEAMATVWVFALLCTPRPGARSGAAAGGLAALALAVSLEPLPVLAVGGALAGLDWVHRGERVRGFAVAFGTGLGVGVPVLLLASVDPQRWLVPACDTISIAWAAPASLGGLGLALVAWSSPASRAKRLAALVAVGAAGLVALLAAAPQCLRGPYAEIDPSLVREWLNDILEAYDIWRLAQVLPGTAAGMVAASLLALIAGVVLWRQGDVDTRRAAMVTTIGALAGTAVMAWAFRGTIYAAVFELPLLVAGAHHLITHRERIPLATPLILLSLLAGFVAVWTRTGPASPGVVAGPAAATQANSQHCDDNADYAELGQAARGLIFNQIDTGPEILAGGPASVVAGPYHRNAAGILDVSRAFVAAPEQAHATIRRRGAGFVLLCRNSAETAIAREQSPDGLAARLLRGDVPGWLEPVPLHPGSGLALWRVRG